MGKYQGKFITFEGSEGCGKSTQAKRLLEHLKEKGLSAKLIREPGGVAISEKVRSILLDKGNTAMNKECETLLYMASRAQLVEEVILPELKLGTILLCDRFLDSTLAYQGYGCGVDTKTIQAMGLFATKGIKPDLTFLLDLDTAEGLRRHSHTPDRIEMRSMEYHGKVRRGYLEIAKKEPKRIVVIDGSLSKDAIFEIVRSRVEKLLER